ncbi:DUF1836 domain-containing protein [Clostridium sp. BJN0001]|uniref:DUF1836 domain-containing protein n=1 Tax=Clostridium sp. BJN0001 TaxID=2930219 RepID=UPI001FD0F9C3|nr:DUF1836 domain-containing protein [Clostridium sp. BJN0001]
MNNINTDAYINEAAKNNNLNPSDIPDIDLYMDQVMQLFETKLSDTKRYPDDKVLTKTMINNYAKDHLLMKIKNKKYTKNHLILMSLIYNLKGSLSLNDIKSLLLPIVESLEDDSAYPLEELYKTYLDLYKLNTDEFKNSSELVCTNIEKLMNKNLDSSDEFYQKFLLILSFVNMSNMYRRASEKMIDNFFNADKEDK